jgi:RES domain-containing protein
MRLYRLGKTIYAKDLTGEGARIMGGRWSPPGISVIHTSQAASLAAMEFLVHLGNPRFIPRGAISMTVYDLADDAALYDLADDDLPGNWNDTPAPPELQAIGRKWATDGSCLALRLPSVPVPVGVEKNVLINPRHPDFAAKFKLVEIHPFEYDKRLLKKL